MLQAGEVVAEKVRLASLLGRGGMGEVWLADHLMLDCPVAVKFLDAALAEDDPSMLERFKAEASIAARLRSPHVVQIFDFGIFAGTRPYIVMELLDGESLGDRLDRTGPMTPREVGMVLRQAAEALGAAHRAGIVHRDIKPDNLFVIESGYELFIKVLDFGIAKQSAIANPKVVTGAWDVVGTPAYMSPEQLVSTKNVDHRTDLWALAIVAYELLTGDVPYMADTVTGFYDAILRQPPPRPSERVAGLPAAVDAWMERALQCDPAARFGSAEQLATAFLEALSAPATLPRAPVPPSAETKPIGSHARVSVSAPTEKPAQRPDTVGGVAGRTRAGGGRTASWLVAAIALLLAGGAGGFWLLDRDVEPRPAASSESSAPEVKLSSSVAPAPPPIASHPAASASATPSAATSTAPPPRPVHRPAARPQPSPPPSTSAPAAPKPPSCSGADAFILDAKGNLKPRPECL
jgi:serine/threonine-protein kinase